jgi:hypothetical protein
MRTHISLPRAHALSLVEIDEARPARSRPSLMLTRKKKSNIDLFPSRSIDSVTSEESGYVLLMNLNDIGQKYYLIGDAGTENLSGFATPSPSPSLFAASTSGSFGGLSPAFPAPSDLGSPLAMGGVLLVQMSRQNSQNSACSNSSRHTGAPVMARGGCILQVRSDSDSSHISGFDDEQLIPTS